MRRMRVILDSYIRVENNASATLIRAIIISIIIIAQNPATNSVQEKTKSLDKKNVKLLPTGPDSAEFGQQPAIRRYVEGGGF